jgi:hypothetical protein
MHPLLGNHSHENGYTLLLADPAPDPAKEFLRPILANASSGHDQQAVDMFQAAFAALCDESYTMAPYGRLSFACKHLFSLACDRFSIGLLDFPTGKVSRFQSLTKTSPDISSAFLKFVPTDAAHAIMCIFDERRALTLPAPVPTPPRPGRHWISLLSLSSTPDHDGYYGTAFYLDLVSSYLIITNAPDASASSLLASLEQFFLHLAPYNNGTCPVATVFVDPSWFQSNNLTLYDASFAPHLAARRYTLKPGQHSRPHGFSGEPILFELATRACSSTDIHVLHLTYLAFQLRNVDRNYDLRHTFLREARAIFLCGTTTVAGILIRRCHALNGPRELPAIHNPIMPANVWSGILDLVYYLPHLRRLHPVHGTD